MATIGVGDIVHLDVPGRSGPWRIETSTGGANRRAQLRRVSEGSLAPIVAGPDPGDARQSLPWTPSPVGWVLNLPHWREPAVDGGVWVGGFADPWPGELSVSAGSTKGQLTERTRLAQPIQWGTLLTGLPPGPIGRWDRAHSLSVKLSAGALSSAERLSVLNGHNLMAVQNAASIWEIIQFQQAILEGEDTYRLDRSVSNIGNDSPKTSLSCLNIPI